MPSWSDVLSVINLAAILAVGFYLTTFKKYWHKYWEKRAEVQATKDDFNEVLRQATETTNAVKRVETLYQEQKSYLEEKGKHRATKEDFDDLLTQLVEQTKSIEGIRKDVQADLDRLRAAEARRAESHLFVRELYAPSVRRYSNEQAHSLRQAYLLLFEPLSSTVSPAGKDFEERLDMAIQLVMQPLRKYVGLLDESTSEKIYDVQNQLLELKGKDPEDVKKKSNHIFAVTEVARQFVKADKIAHRLGLIDHPLEGRTANE